MSINIRSICEDDFEDMAELLTCQKEQEWVFPTATLPIDSTQIKARATHRDFIIILKDEELVGFANLYREDGKMFVGNFAIKETHRNQGYGKRLLVLMRERARAVYREKELHISVVKENHVAMKLYEDFGFVRYGVEIFTTPKGEYLSFVHMKMEI